jgi:lysine biosynthesis protein LysW
MAGGHCPDCGIKIALGRDPKKGQMVTCPKCSAYLELINISPIELDWAIEDEDDQPDEAYDERSGRHP